MIYNMGRCYSRLSIAQLLVYFETMRYSGICNKLDFNFTQELLIHNSIILRL
jgi:hypothetical protein